MAERRFDWRVPLLAVAIGAIAGGLGVFTSRHDEPPAAREPAAVAKAEHRFEDEDGLAADSRAEKARLKFEPNLDLLTQCDGKPVTASVRVRRLDQEPTRTRWTEVSRGKTDPEGKAALMLAPGNYGVAASAPCGSAQQLVVVRAGEARHTLTVTLDPGRAIAGRVVEAGSNNPVPDALVSARSMMRLPSGQSEPMVEEEAATATADSLGRFRIESVPMARQVVHATANGFGDAEVEVEADANGELKLSLERSCPLSGVVRGGDGAVTLTVRSGTNEASVFANPDGTFRALAPPGDVQVVARSAAGLIALTRFPLTRECGAKPLDLVLRSAARITGKAVVDGAAASCARVWARTEADSYELASAQAGPDGAFALEGLPPGFYWVLASCASGERGDVLHVEPGAKIELAMRGASSLSGRVTGEDNQPVAGAKIELGPVRGAGYEALTDERGEYAFEHLPAVSMWIGAHANGAASEDQQIQLRPGQAERVDLKVVKTGTLIGHVKGKVPPRAIAFIHEMDGHGGTRVDISETGDFKTEVAPGKYGVRGSGMHGTELFPLAVVEVGVGQTVERDFEVSESPERTDLHFSSVTPGEIGVMFDRGPGGLAISWIATNGPAYAAGVREGDLVLSIDGQALDDTVEAYQRARGQPGTSMVIQVRREGRDQQLAVSRAGKQEPF